MPSIPILPDVEPLDGHVSSPSYPLDQSGERLAFDAAVARDGVDQVLVALLWEARRTALAARTAAPAASVFISYRRCPTYTEELVQRLAFVLRERHYSVSIDVDNLSTDPRAIPAFISSVWQSETILLLHSAEFALGGERTWIREERRAALIAALTGSADILIARLDNQPFQDPWMGFFPVIDLVDRSQPLDRVLAPFFPERLRRGDDSASNFDAVAADVRAVVRGKPSDLERSALVSHLANIRATMLWPRQAQELALARCLLGSPNAGDEQLVQEHFDRVEGRRLKIAQFVADSGFRGDAIRFLQPHFRRSNLQWQSHTLAAELLESEGVDFLAARNHYCAASRLSEIKGATASQRACSLGAWACAAKAQIASLASIDRNGAESCWHGDPMREQILAIPIGAGVEIASAIDRNIRKVALTAPVLTAAPPGSELYLLCNSCFACYSIGTPNDRICACCSHTTTLSPAAVQAEELAHANGPLQTKVLRTPRREILCLEVKSPVFRCGLCAYPGLIPWQQCIASGESSLGCPLCGSGQLNPLTPQQLRSIRIARTTPADHRSSC